MLKVTLKKSLIGNTPANRATVYALGLRKIGQSNTFESSASILGMIHKVKHLLQVEETQEGTVVRRRKGHKAEGTAPAQQKESKRTAKVKATTAPKAVAKPVASKKAEPKAKKSESKATKAEESKPKRTTRTKKSED